MCNMYCALPFAVHLVHFPSEACKSKFTTSPPYQALIQGNASLPAKITLSVSFAIAPLDASTTDTPDSATL